MREKKLKSMIRTFVSDAKLEKKKKKKKKKKLDLKGIIGLVLFYGISTFIGYLTPNPFLCK